MTYVINPSRFASSLEGFIIHMETTGAAETVTLPLTHTGVTVDWGDGGATEDIASGGAVAHEYATADTYRIVVTGTASEFSFNNGGDKLKARRVENWGDLGWTSMARAFYGCTGLTTVDATDGANLASVTSMIDMFRGCSSITSLDVSGFATSSVTSMIYMFQNCSSLTSDPGIVSFDISALTNATNMCQNANSMLSTAEYDAILVAWEAQTELANVTVHFGDATYTSGGAAATARAALVANGWVITDGGSV